MAEPTEELKAPEEVIPPNSCGFCGKEIKAGDKLIEVVTDLGVHRVGNEGNIPGLDVVHRSERNYAHMRHFVFVKERS